MISEYSYSSPNENSVSNLTKAFVKNFFMRTFFPRKKHNLYTPNSRFPLKSLFSCVSETPNFELLGKEGTLDRLSKCQICISGWGGWEGESLASGNSSLLFTRQIKLGISPPVSLKYQQKELASISWIIISFSLKASQIVQVFSNEDCLFICDSPTTRIKEMWGQTQSYPF